VRVTMRDSSPGRPVLDLVAPSGVRIETPASWAPTVREAAWRIVPEHEGEYELMVSVGASQVSKRVVVGGRKIIRRSPMRVERGFVNGLLYPAEAPLPPESQFRAVHVAYPERALAVFGLRFHWLVLYFGLTLLFALALRRPLRTVL
jgi:hypothetical protein